MPYAHPVPNSKKSPHITPITSSTLHERVGRHPVASTAVLPWSARAFHVALRVRHRRRNVGANSAEALDSMQVKRAFEGGKWGGVE